MNTLNTDGVEVTDILEELDRLRAVNAQLKDALEWTMEALAWYKGHNFQDDSGTTVGELAREALKAAS
jgi:hypothetical protein